MDVLTDVGHMPVTL